jgi:acyl-CoA thioesterase I
MHIVAELDMKEGRMRWLCFVFLLACLYVVDAKAQIVALGASNTAGYGVSPSESFPAQLEMLLHKRGLNVTVKNAGVSGDTSLDMLNRLDSAVPDGTRVVIFSTGAGNDASARNVDHDRNVRTVVEKLRARKIGIVILGPFTDRLSGTTYCGNLSYVPAQYRFGHRGAHLSAEGYSIMAEHLLPCVMRAWGKS